MANVNDTVREAILCYPILYSNAHDVLYSIFFINGNGYEWRNGEAVNIEHDVSPKAHWTPEEEREERNTTNYSSAMLAIIDDHVSKQIAKFSEIVATVDSRMLDMTADESRSSIYPQHEYALLTTMPKNVTDDWRAACEAMRPYAVQHGWKI